MKKVVLRSFNEVVLKTRVKLLVHPIKKLKTSILNNVFLPCVY